MNYGKTTSDLNKIYLYCTTSTSLSMKTVVSELHQIIFEKYESF